MMGGSSMKTAMGSLLQSEFRKRGVESIREAQIGTGLSRADVVDWVAKANTILEVHEDIDLFSYSSLAMTVRPSLIPTMRYWHVMGVMNGLPFI